MKNSYLLRHTAIAGLALTLSCSAITSFAAEVSSAADVIDTRQHGFKKMGGAMKVFRTQLREDTPDANAMSAAADTIALYAKDVSTWFPEGSGADSGLDTDALDYIWKNPTKFDGYSQALVRTSQQLVEAVASNDKGSIKAAVVAVKDSCSDCHSSFRAD